MAAGKPARAVSIASTPAARLSPASIARIVNTAPVTRKTKLRAIPARETVATVSRVQPTVPPTADTKSAGTATLSNRGTAEKARYSVEPPRRGVVCIRRATVAKMTASASTAIEITDQPVFRPPNSQAPRPAGAPQNAGRLQPRVGHTSYPVPVRRLARSDRASFRPHLARGLSSRSFCAMPGTHARGDRHVERMRASGRSTAWLADQVSQEVDRPRSEFDMTPSRSPIWLDAGPVTAFPQCTTISAGWRT